MTVVAKDGSRFTQYLQTALGGTAYPLSLEQVAGVSRSYLERFMPAERRRRVTELLLALDVQPDVRELMNLLGTKIP